MRRSAHDHNRIARGTGRPTNSWENVMRWIKYFNQRYIDLGRDPDLWHVDALLTALRKIMAD